MRLLTPSRALLAAVPVALLLSGCGGGSGSGSDNGAVANTGASSAGSSAASGGRSGAYQGGFEICSGSSVEEVAVGYGVSPATPDAVSDSIAEAVSGGTPRDAKDAKQGCLDALAKSK